MLSLTQLITECIICKPGSMTRVEWFTWNPLTGILLEPASFCLAKQVLMFLGFKMANFCQQILIKSLGLYTWGFYCIAWQQNTEQSTAKSEKQDRKKSNNLRLSAYHSLERSHRQTSMGCESLHWGLWQATHVILADHGFASHHWKMNIRVCWCSWKTEQRTTRKGWWLLSTSPVKSANLHALHC